MEGGADKRRAQRPGYLLQVSVIYILQGAVPRKLQQHGHLNNEWHYQLPCHAKVNGGTS